MFVYFIETQSARIQTIALKVRSHVFHPDVILLTYSGKVNDGVSCFSPQIFQQYDAMTRQDDAVRGAKMQEQGRKQQEVATEMKQHPTASKKICNFFFYLF